MDIGQPTSLLEALPRDLLFEVAARLDVPSLVCLACSSRLLRFHFDKEMVSMKPFLILSAMEGYHGLLEYVRALGCSGVTGNVIAEAAVIGGHVETVAYIHSLSPLSPSLVESTLFPRSVLEGKKEVFRWLLERYPSYLSDQTFRLLGLRNWGPILDEVERSRREKLPQNLQSIERSIYKSPIYVPSIASTMYGAAVGEWTDLLLYLIESTAAVDISMVERAAVEAGAVRTLKFLRSYGYDIEQEMMDEAKEVCRTHRLSPLSGRHPHLDPWTTTFSFPNSPSPPSSSSSSSSTTFLDWTDELQELPQKAPLLNLPLWITNDFVKPLTTRPFQHLTDYYYKWLPSKSQNITNSDRYESVGERRIQFVNERYAMFLKGMSFTDAITAASMTGDLSAVDILLRDQLERSDNSNIRANDTCSNLKC